MNMQAVTESHKQTTTKNRHVTATYFCDGVLVEKTLDMGNQEDRDKSLKILYWAAVNGVEIRIRPINMRPVA